MKMGRPPKNQGKIPHFEQKGNSFYHVPATGERKWTPLGNDRAAALVKWASIEGRTDNGSFADLFRWFMANSKIETSTRKNYEIQGKAVLKIFGDGPPDEITTEQIGAFKAKCTSPIAKELKCGTGTMNVRIGLMKSVYAAAKEAGLCKNNPARDVARFKRVKRDRYITDAEFISIRENAPDYLGVAMNIAYQIGCRPCDVAKMRLSDINDEGVFLQAKKTGKKTLYSMAPDLRSALDEAKALVRGVKSLYVLSDWRGKPYTVNALGEAWNAACKAAGVEGAQHRDIRAKNASDDPEGAQARLQHSTREQTNTYIRKTPVVMPLARKL